jgi:dihydropyrimidinase
MPLAQALEDWKGKAASRSIIDYGFHIALSEINDAVLSQIPALIDSGVASFKVCLDGAGERRIGDGALFEFLQRTAAAGALPCVHAENGEVVDLLSRRLASDGKASPKSLGMARPPELEAEAASRVLALAELARAPVYLTNISSAHAIEKVKAARDRGLPVYAETCSQYLIMGSDRYDEPEGIKYYTTPPLRPSWHQDVLWRALSSRDIQVIGSDHMAFSYAGQKDLGKEDFTHAPRGFPGIQERLALFCSAAIQAPKLTINQVVDLLSTTPARLFGLFPKKGTLAVGSDADMIVFDPRADQVLSKSIGLSRADFSPYEGMKVRGAPWLVIQRGRVIAREGKVMGRPGSGEYLSRSRFSAI